jgi:adenylate cyclase
LSLLGELKRRNVTRVAALYLVAAWVILQVAELLFEALAVPSEWLRFLIALLVIVFPVVLVFSWIYEVTPDGIRREKDISPDESITAHTGKRINVAILILLVVAIGVVVLDRLVPEAAPPEPIAAAQETIEPGLPDERSIAVLPFADLSPQKDQEYFADGIAEEILNVLVRVEGLSVASRTTSFGFKGQESLGIPYMADKMQVRHVLEGSVRKAGDAVRITAQLIDATDDKHLWSETYDRRLSAESIFEIQDDIARAIVNALGVIIDNGEAVETRADTQDLDAYSAYLEANQLFRSRLDLARSFALFEQAIAKDPKFARAWAGLAAVATVMPSWGFEDRNYVAISEEAAKEAIDLDEGLALPYAVLGLFASNTANDYEASIAYLAKSLERDPKEATTHLWRGIELMRLGYFDNAIDDFLACLDIDPRYELCRRHQANALMYMGDYDGAERVYLQGLEAGFVGGDQLLQILLAARGQRAAFSLAIARFLNRAGLNALTDFMVRAAFDPNYDFTVERPAIEAAFQKATGSPLDWEAEYFMAFYLHNFDAYMRNLDHELGRTGASFDIGEAWAPFPDAWSGSEHPKRMMRGDGLPEYWRKHGFPKQCRPVGHSDFDCQVGPQTKKRPAGQVN